MGVQAVMDAILLGALLVAIWEWESTVARRHWPKLAPLALAAGPPTALALVSLFTPVPVPVGVYGVSLFALWFLARSPWVAVGCAASALGVAVTGLSRWGMSPHLLYALITIVGAGVIVCVVPCSRRRRIPCGIGYFAVLVALTDVLRVNRDPWLDIAVTILVAGMDAAYVIGRSERERSFALQVQRAEHDALTGCLTRHGLEAWLRERAREGRPRGLVIACDLDDFKWFNDTFGHDVGDEVLREFARRLRAGLRPQDALSRPGGDEFTAFMAEVRPEDAGAIVERLHQAVAGRAFIAGVGAFDLGVSMGWAVGEFDEKTLAAADQALLDSKRHGKNRASGSRGDSRVAAAGEVPRVRLGWLSDAARLLWRYWPTAAVLTDAAGKIVAVNPSFERLTGRAEPDLIDRNPSIQASGHTSPEVYRDLWATVGRCEAWEGVLENRRPDGSLWWARECIVPVRLGDEVVGYWGTLVEDDPGAHRSSA